MKQGISDQPHTPTGGISVEILNCDKCKARIVNHIWWVRGRKYCGPSCERDGKSQFEKVYKALAQMKK